MTDSFKELYDRARRKLDSSTDRQVRLHFLAARRWFGWREHDPSYDEKTREDQIDAILHADPVAVEGGAFDFWAHRGIIPKLLVCCWRKDNV